ncbi:MAG: [Fe-Fe] hydrogenase large subunit C-terminal domain-containing protein [Halanaerobiales bacterium]
MSNKHSVLLKEDKCEGCTNCVKNCPTKAIRVHQGKAKIKEDLCIDCAECIRTCEYHAKYAETNRLEDLDKNDYNVALLAPSFYGQFDSTFDPESIKKAVYKLGFDEVWDVAQAAEAISQKTVQFLKNNQGTYISSSCPVIVRLISLLYPELLDNIISFNSPVDLMADYVKKELYDSSIEEFGIYFITPCPAKVTAIKNPLGREKSSLTGAISVDKVYPMLLDLIKNDEKLENVELKQNYQPYLGIFWGQSGGENDILNYEGIIETLSVSGIHNIKGVLEETTRGNIEGIRYLELVACPTGCVGGIFNVKNPFQAKYNIKTNVREYSDFIDQDIEEFNFELSKRIKEIGAEKLDEDFAKAMDKLEQLEKEIEILPGFDCAACGAPDCETFAEDIVNGLAKRSDCIFVLRKEIGDLADQLSLLTHELPPVMRSEEKQKKTKKNNGVE